MKPKIENWALTPHAAQRIFDRHVSLEEITQLLTSPEDVVSQGPKLILTKTFGRRKDNKVAAVVIEKKGDELWLVITVMVNFQTKSMEKNQKST